jgi:hypothetical protein
MAFSDFLNNDLATQTGVLSAEIDKVYQRANLAGKHEVVDRLRRQSTALAGKVKLAQASRVATQTVPLLEESLRLTHECIPLMDLCLRKSLLSSDLHQRWTQKFSDTARQLEEWKIAAERKPR